MGGHPFTVALASMNFRYFACPRCRTYTSAGYRWAYWSLEEKGIVAPMQVVDLEKLLGVSDYWNPPHEPQSEWLYEQVFPLVKEFLSEHQSHGIIYVESGEFFGLEDIDSWLEIETEDKSLSEKRG